jgi:hypothetical protein
VNGAHSVIERNAELQGLVMAGNVVETLYGKRHKYEIREVRSWLKTQFAIYRDGSRWKGDYDSLARAVEVAKDAE